MDMTERVNFHEKGKQALGVLSGMGRYLAKSTLEKPLLSLIHFRVSQINGCAYCLDMHSKDLRAEGETEQRLYLLHAWRESPFYTSRECAALAWSESVTHLTDGLMPEAIYAEASRHFSDIELIDLTVAVIQINSYNRLNMAFGGPVGTYQVGQFD